MANNPSFRQQNLPAWQPILTAGTVLPTFFLIGVAFVPIGFALLMSSMSVQEYTLDYTDCRSISEPNTTCEYIITHRKSQEPCKCLLEFELMEDFRRDVYVYYGLTNFYQNHRRYVKSRDDRQLSGDINSASSDCAPYRFDPETKLPYAPCGAIANSRFNDTFNLKWQKEELNYVKIILQKEGIAWPSDRNIRFKNPPGFMEDRKKPFLNTTKPRDWPIPVYELAPKKPENNGFQNEDLIVWMRTAALPRFRKLYGIVADAGELKKAEKEVLPKGKYQLHIDYHYPVAMFHGQKRFIISNTSWLGGKNHFLAIAYIVVGCICFLLSALLLYIHKRYGRLPSELI